MSGQPGRSGGARVGAGRKPKNGLQRWLGGHAGKRGTREGEAPTLPPVTVLEPPAGIGDRQRLVWRELAQHAATQRTLIPATAADFRELCELIVEKDDVRAERRTEGWTPRGMFLAKEYRGLVQRIEAKMRGFRLSPIGKEMVAPEAPKDEWAEFDDGSAASVN